MLVFFLFLNSSNHIIFKMVGVKVGIYLSRKGPFYLSAVDLLE